MNERIRAELSDLLALAAVAADLDIVELERLGHLATLFYCDHLSPISPEPL